MRQNAGLTLIEIMVGLLLASILFLAVTRIFSGGMRITQKGTSHLTNIQVCGILMAQIEQDLARTVKILPLPEGGTPDQIILEVKEEEGHSVVKYETSPDKSGFQRSLFKGASDPGKTFLHVFGRGLTVNVEFHPHLIEGRIGYLVKITTVSRAQTEETCLSRFVYCGNLPENQQFISLGWKWD